MTRRELIWRAGKAGGYGAAFVAMRSLGLLADAQTEPISLDFPADIGRGTKVAILGSGIAGLVAAYELRKLGFDCTVLEARDRPGGRNWTIRRGDKVEFVDGTVQQCAFDDGLYLNAGPGRIPSIHRIILGYCRELGVPMEVEVNVSRSALVQGDDVFDQQPIEQRQAINDMRGHVAELLAKAIRQGALDEEVTAVDHERMLAFLRAFGDLQADYVYAGSSRAGARRLPGAGDVEEERRTPLALNALVNASFWQGLMLEERLDMQATMFQAVGGMDRISYAFARRLGGVVKYRCAVTAIRKTSTGVRIVYTDQGSRATRSLEASYCVVYSADQRSRHDAKRSVAACEIGNDAGDVCSGLQDRLAVAPLLGTGEQHLRWHLLARERSNQPRVGLRACERVVPQRPDVLEHRRARRRVWSRYRRLRQPALDDRQARRFPGGGREASPWPVT